MEEEVNVADEGTELNSMQASSEPIMKMKNKNSTNLDKHPKKPFERI
jgi:hypothetical protein